MAKKTTHADQINGDRSESGHLDRASRFEDKGGDHIDGHGFDPTATDPGVGGKRSRWRVNDDGLLALIGRQCTDLDQAGDGADGGVAAQVGVAPGVHIKKAEIAVRAYRLGDHRGHDSPVATRFAGEQFAHGIKPGLKIIAFCLDREPVKGAHAADQ